MSNRFPGVDSATVRSCPESGRKQLDALRACVGIADRVRWGIVLVVLASMFAPLPVLARSASGTISVHVGVECPLADRRMAEQCASALWVTSTAEDGNIYPPCALASDDGEATFTIDSVPDGAYTIQIGGLEVLGEDWQLTPDMETVQVVEGHTMPVAKFVLKCENPDADPTPSVPVSAPATGLTMQVEAHFEGRFKYGEWLPLRITLENNGPDLSGEVQVTVSGYGGDSTYGVLASLPQTSRKQLTLYVLPNSYSRQLTVNLVTTEEVLLSQKVQVLPLSNVHYLIGVVAADPDSLSLLAGLDLHQRAETEVVSFPLDQLPERVEGLRSFDCLVINDVDTSTLTSGQRTAVAQWVGSGGRLVVGGGPGARRTVSGLPAELLAGSLETPLEMTSLTALEAFAGNEEQIRVPGPFAVAPVDAKGGNALVVEGDVPLVVERALGDGFVDYVALDLTLSPLDAWAGNLAFWRTLLQPGAAYPEYLPADVSRRELDAQQMMYALQNLPAMDLPSVKGLAILLMAYVLLVGPINYLVLRRVKRLDWAWVTIPLLTIGFSAGALGIGYALRGSEIVLNKISIIQSMPGSPAAVVRSYIGLFSPSRQAYQIDVSGGALVSPLAAEYDPWGGSNVGGNMSVLQGEPSRVRGLSVNQWSMQTFMAESVTAEPLTIQADLELREGHLIGTVTNRTGKRLSDCVLVKSSNYARLGDVEPGESKEVDLDLSGQDLRIFERMVWQIPEAQQPSSPFDRQAELRRMVLEGVFNPYQEGTFRAVTSPQATFFGWLDESPPDVAVEGYALTVQETSLLLAALPLSFGQGKVSVPASMYSKRLVEGSGEISTCDPMGMSFYLGRGSVTMELQPPSGLSGVSVEEMKLIVSSEAGWQEVPETSLYDWQRDEWVLMDDVSMGRNRVEDPGRFVEPTTGAIWVKLESTSSGMGGCLYVDVELEGERSE